MTSRFLGRINLKFNSVLPLFDLFFTFWASFVNSMTFPAGHGEICPPHVVLHMATRRPAHNTPIHMDFLYGFLLKSTESTWIGVLWAGLRVAMWITRGGQISPWPARKVTELEPLLSRQSRTTVWKSQFTQTLGPWWKMLRIGH